MPNIFFFQTEYSFYKSNLLISDLIAYAKQHKHSAIGVCDTTPFGFLPLINACALEKINLSLGLQFNSDEAVFCAYALNQTGLKKLYQLYQLSLTSEQFSFLQCLELAKTEILTQDLIIIVQKISSPLYESVSLLKLKLYYDFSISKIINVTLPLQWVVDWKVYSCWTDQQYQALVLLNALSEKQNACFSFAQLSQLKVKSLTPELSSEVVKKNTLNLNNLLKNGQILIDNNLKIPNLESKYLEWEKICHANLKIYLKANPHLNANGYKERLAAEIKVIQQLKFANYFAVVADYVNFARENQIYVGTGRGSSNSSLVAFLLKITAVDPLQYGLLFERFLNLERQNLPDIDVDFESAKRHQVIAYLHEKYQDNYVSQIPTYAQFTIKTALKAVLSLIKLPVNSSLVTLVDSVTSSLSPEENVSVVLAQKKLLINKLLQNDQEFANLWNLTKPLINVKHKLSIHPAGIVISSAPLQNYVATWKVAPYNFNLCSASMNELAHSGLVKFDILSLSTLTFIHEVIDLINANKSIKPVNFLATTDYANAKVFTFLKTLLFTGIFQLESMGMKACLKAVEPTNINHLIAAISLFRPSTKSYIKVYATRKNTQASFSWGHKVIDEILQETYGIILYQEQIMLLLHKLLKLPLTKTNQIIKDMSKGNQAQMASFQKDFFASEIIKKLSVSMQKKFFNDLCLFFQYGFNKAHATSYALLIYQMLYLKSYYPVAFFQKLIDNAHQDEQKLNVIANELKHPFFKFKLVSFDLNYSKYLTSFANNSFYLSYKCCTNLTLNEATVVSKHWHHLKLSLNSFSDIVHFKNALLKDFSTPQVINILLELNQAQAFFQNQAQAFNLYSSCFFPVDNVKLVPYATSSNLTNLKAKWKTLSVNQRQERLQNALKERLEHYLW